MSGSIETQSQKNKEDQAKSNTNALQTARSNQSCGKIKPERSVSRHHRCTMEHSHNATVNQTQTKNNHNQSYASTKRINHSNFKNHSIIKEIEVECDNLKSPQNNQENKLKLSIKTSHSKSLQSQQLSYNSRLSQKQKIKNVVSTQSIDCLQDINDEIKNSLRLIMKDQQKVQDQMISQNMIPQSTVQSPKFENVLRDSMKINNNRPTSVRQSICAKNSNHSSMKSLSTQQNSVRQSLKNIKPLDLNTRRSRDYRQIEQSQKVHYKQLESCSGFNQSSQASTNTGIQSQKTIKAMSQIQSLNNKIKDLNEEILEMKKQKGAYQINNILSPKISEYRVKNSNIKPVLLRESVSGTISYQSRVMSCKAADNNRINVLEEAVSDFINAQKVKKVFSLTELRNKVGLRYLNGKNFKYAFDEISQFSGGLQGQSLNQKVNKHVFLGHMLEFLMDILDTREEHQSKYLRDGLKQIYRTVKQDGAHVSLPDLYMAVLIIRSQKLSVQDIDEAFTFFCKSQIITNYQLEALLTSIIRVWFLIYPNSSVGRAIKNMKLKAEDIARVLADQISQLSNSKIMAQSIIIWINQPIQKRDKSMERGQSPSVQYKANARQLANNHQISINSEFNCKNYQTVLQQYIQEEDSLSFVSNHNNAILDDEVITSNLSFTDEMQYQKQLPQGRCQTSHYIQNVPPKVNHEHLRKTSQTQCNQRKSVNGKSIMMESTIYNNQSDHLSCFNQSINATTPNHYKPQLHQYKTQALNQQQKDLDKYQQSSQMPTISYITNDITNDQTLNAVRNDNYLINNTNHHQYKRPQIMTQNHSIAGFQDMTKFNHTISPQNPQQSFDVRGYETQNFYSNQKQQNHPPSIISNGSQTRSIIQNPRMQKNNAFIQSHYNSLSNHHIHQKVKIDQRAHIQQQMMTQIQGQSMANQNQASQQHHNYLNYQTNIPMKSNYKTLQDTMEQRGYQSNISARDLDYLRLIKNPPNMMIIQDL
ncbi:UNKNOWN [Stylonychia lemnae]|uniref:Uncharacterized protein n=1 Tax=Stylonychia lemnae TaxID=5949 RepID=A0A078A112_STYLE|nr:UNKNOWN [Stylonychia lemnae]|eukprot:CDW74469.1 UNKNOWN [Stylonychia lemnae]